MILVIWPLGKAAKDIREWIFRVFMYTAGSAVGGALFALALGLVGQGIHVLIPSFGGGWTVLVLGVAALAYALHELNMIRLPNPQRGWLVPKEWMGPGRLWGNTLYGIVLGMGVWTFIPFTSFYILLGWELSAGAVSLQAAVLLGLLYGAIRGIPAVLGGISMLRGQYPLPVTNWLTQHLGWWHALNGLALILLGTFAVGSFIL